MRKILKFSATWCAPCATLAATLATLDLGVLIEEIDIEENSELAAAYRVRGVPTLVLLDDNGNEVKRQTGALTAAQLKVFVI